MLRETLVPECDCPHCGAVINGATHLGDATPSPGDGVLCGQCLRLSEVAADLTVKPISLEALAKLSRKELEDTLGYLAARRARHVGGSSAATPVLTGRRPGA
jgi:hypothetical protein